jgi:hypothetical protein
MEFVVEQLADLTAKQRQTDASLNRLANAALSRIERIEGALGLWPRLRSEPRNMLRLWLRRNSAPRRGAPRRTNG